MRILADEHIPYVREVFGYLGDVRTFPGRDISPALVQGADAMIVRTVSPINAALLNDSPVKFVGTATSGIDHIDVSYLEAAGIKFAHAQGANARSVAEYVLAGLLEVTERDIKALSAYRCGIVGYGHVGSMVYSMLSGLGVSCCVYDPFVSKESSSIPFCAWEEILAQEIITFHVPLTMDGPHPTFHLLDESFLNAVGDDTILVNTSRGGVMDEKALLFAKRVKPHLRCIVDVWENEPDISLEVLANCDLATAHIAGYSWDAKVEATRRVYRAACEYFEETVKWNEPSDTSKSLVEPVDLASLSEEALRSHVRQGYCIRSDDAALRQVLGAQGVSVATVFDSLRNTYGPRREFSLSEGSKF